VEHIRAFVFKQSRCAWPRSQILSRPAQGHGWPLTRSSDPIVFCHSATIDPPGTKKTDRSCMGQRCLRTRAQISFSYVGQQEPSSLAALISILLIISKARCCSCFALLEFLCSISFGAHRPRMIYMSSIGSLQYRSNRPADLTVSTPMDPSAA
jgi:hypothetical protein